MAAATAITASISAPWLTDSFLRLFRVTATLDTASVTTGNQTTDTVAVTGVPTPNSSVAGFGVTVPTTDAVALGDMILALSTGVSLQGLQRTAYVDSAGSVTIVTKNDTGGTLDLAATTIRLLVGRPVF